MADQRILLKCEGKEIVLAKRQGDTWISAQDEINDLGSFLNSINTYRNRPIVLISYEHKESEDLRYCDPIFISW